MALKDTKTKCGKLKTALNEAVMDCFEKLHSTCLERLRNIPRNLSTS
jgi:hypothetical protein